MLKYPWRPGPFRVRSTLLGAFAVLALCVLCVTPAAQASAQANAQANACPGLFVGGRPPVMGGEARRTKTRELCYAGFAVLHSGVTHGPLWSAERITAAAVRAAWANQREDGFHADRRLPFIERAELFDYRGSGYDRGHMAPNADFATKEAAAESFTLANIVPQDPSSNRYLWADIERAARDLALAHGEIYVVTGPAYIGERIGWIGRGRLPVPTHLFKAVYIPALRAGGAWLAANAPGDSWKPITLIELAALAKIDAFPAAHDARPLAMPAPRKRSTK